MSALLAEIVQLAESARVNLWCGRLGWAAQEPASASRRVRPVDAINGVHYHSRFS